MRTPLFSLRSAGARRTDRHLAVRLNYTEIGTSPRPQAKAQRTSGGPWL